MQNQFLYANMDLGCKDNKRRNKCDITLLWTNTDKSGKMVKGMFCGELCIPGKKTGHNPIRFEVIRGI